MIEEITNKPIYKTSDGTEFIDKYDAIEHENKISDIYNRLNKYKINKQLLWFDDIVNKREFDVYKCNTEEEYKEFIDTVKLAHFMLPTDDKDDVCNINLVNKTDFRPNEDNYYIIFDDCELIFMLSNDNSQNMYIFNLIEAKTKLAQMSASIDRILGNMSEDSSKDD